MPIVCVNVDGFYEPFREMLSKAYADKLIRLKPDEIVHFAPDAEEAIRWVEAEKEKMEAMQQSKDIPPPARRSSALKRSSIFSAPPAATKELGALGKVEEEGTVGSWPSLAFQAGMVFAAGVLVGVSVSRR